MPVISFDFLVTDILPTGQKEAARRRPGFVAGRLRRSIFLRAAPDRVLALCARKTTYQAASLVNM
jgi:hypothetical protein